MSKTEGEDYIKTTTHNFISRDAKIEGPRNVELKGRSIVEDMVTLRGDLAVIRIGRYCLIREQTVLEPTKMVDSEKRIPMVIGNHTHIGMKCDIKAAAIGSMVWIGDSVKIGKRCIIKDCCVIESDVVLGDDTIIPPFTRVTSYAPMHPQQGLPASISVELQEITMESYQDFVCRQQEKRKAGSQ